MIGTNHALPCLAVFDGPRLSGRMSRTVSGPMCVIAFAKTSSALSLFWNASLVLSSPIVCTALLRSGTDLQRKFSSIDVSTVNTSIHAAWYLTSSSPFITLASLSKHLSSIIEGSRMMLAGMQLTRKDVKHSEADTLML